MNQIIKHDSRSKEDGLAQISPFSLLDRFFDDALFDPFRSTSLLGTRALGNMMHSSFPKVDVTESEKEISVIANIPGIDPNQLNIEVGDDYLALSGKVEKETR